MEIGCCCCCCFFLVGGNENNLKTVEFFCCRNDFARSFMFFLQEDLRGDRMRLKNFRTNKIIFPPTKTVCGLESRYDEGSRKENHSPNTCQTPHREAHYLKVLQICRQRRQVMFLSGSFYERMAQHTTLVGCCKRG